ncbi:MarR family winged helix-turn-helix transcriptional regulator [Pseudonocardia sp. T1-2H]|uniref:MarR family winged helix-turn-helix transcriptional regulator n=1 Tax=Pseudonocardia sp. T1-2H TaxID=3128899 RepID=UPI003101484D
MFDDQLFHVMRVVFQEHTARWSAALPELTKPQFAVLSAIAASPGIEQSALTVAAASSKATLAEMLGRLEARGLLTRTVDPGDSRRRFVSLTDEGRGVVSRAEPVADRIRDSMLSELSLEERATLLDLLRRIRS